MTAVQTHAILVFFVTFTLIAVEAINRTHASILGAFVFVLIGAVSPEEFLQFIDIEILAVILGLFLLVKGAERSGLFQLMAVKIMRNSKSPTAFAVIILSFTVLLSLLVSNIGSMLIMASITITMARSLKIKPQTLLIFQVIVINVGGMTLLTGSIPNIIISIEGKLSFMDFIVNVLPLGLLLFAATLLFFVKFFKKDFTPEPGAEFREMEFDEWIERAIDVSGLRGSRMDRWKMSAAVILIGTMVGFVIYERFDLTLPFVALAGGFLMMFQSKEPSIILREIDWSTILFLGSLFIMINGLGKIGIIDILSHWLLGIIGRTPLRASISLMWLSGLVSSIVDNIPLSTSLAPIVRELVIDDSWATLWWGLVIGANLGGNMTPIGSPSNIIAIGISEKAGYPISFTTFLKMGLGITVVHFIISMIYLYVRYCILST